MNRYFLGKLEVVTGEYSNNVSYLIVAQNPAKAALALDEVAREYYGNAEDDESDEDAANDELDGGYYANGGEVLVVPRSIQEIGVAGFDSLRNVLPVRYGELTRQDSEVPADFAVFAQSLTKLLNGSLHTEKLAHGQVLNALASSFGRNNWKVLRQHIGTINEALKAASKMAPGAQASPHFEYLVGLPPAETIGEAYDTDAELREALNALIPEFEYPDWSYKTVGEAVAYINRASQIR